MRKALLFLVAFSMQFALAQTAPINSSVSNFGTSFVFGPTPIGKNHIEGELGCTSLDDQRLLSSAITLAPFSTRTDITVLTNLLESEMPVGRRTTHSGSRVDIVMRNLILEQNGFALGVAPRASFLIRNESGGRVGATIAGQYNTGNNLYVANLTATAGVKNSASNPSRDYIGAFDYYRTISTAGAAFFVGCQYEKPTNALRTISIEQGLVIPLRDGQVEFAIEELNINLRTVLQFQVRVTLNFGK